MTSLNSKRPYGSAAKLYRGIGWLGTLPLPQGKKNSPPTGFTGGGRPHPTDGEIEKWLKTKPDGNLALRLAEVPDGFLEDLDLPVVYGNNTVDGWELIGLDVDDYKNKKGADQLAALEEELGALPATAMSSARWENWPAKPSAIRVFLVPKGYRYMGKAADCIEIVQKRHRYMCAWPSINPDANNQLYEWRWGASGFDSAFAQGVLPTVAGVGSNPLEAFEGGIPAMADVAVLPEAWFMYLSRSGQAETNDPISSMTDDELWVWATTTLRYASPPEGSRPLNDLAVDEPDPGNYEGYEPCKWMVEAVEQYVGELDSSADSHPKLAKAHWRILNLAAEGHAGLEWAMMEYHTAWGRHVMENRGGDPEDVNDEITRSVLGALSKIEPIWAGKPLQDDTCAVAKQVANGEWEERVGGWGAKLEDLIAERDFGGLGPVVGVMEVADAKPAGEYEQNDAGNAEHLLDLYTNNVKFVDGRDSWVLWDGERWHRDVGNRQVRNAYSRVQQRQKSYAIELFQQAEEVGLGMASEQQEALEGYDPAADAKAIRANAKSWQNWARRSGDLSPVKNAIESAISRHVNNDPVAVKATVFDSRPDLLGCANGVLQLSNDPELRPPDKADYVTFNTHVDYVPWRDLANSTNDETLEGLSLWLEYLNTFLPDQQVQKYIQKVLGHTIVGGNPEKLLIFMHGPHDTGKSTMLGAIKGAMGDYYGTVDLSLFRQRDLNPGLIRAVPLRITGMSEVDAGTMDAATVKRLTGNDPVQAEAKYSNEIFEGRPQFTTIIACNNAPSIKNADEALNERLMILPFKKTIERIARKYEKQSQIESHSSVAVLSWLVEGWKLYCAEGLREAPTEVLRGKRQMLTELNDTQGFISDTFIKAEQTKEGRRVRAEAEEKARERGKDVPQLVDWPDDWTISTSQVFELYTRWCSTNNSQAESSIALSKQLGLGRAEAKSVGGKTKKFYMGVKLRGIG